MKKKGQANTLIAIGMGVIILVILLGVIFTFIKDNALDIHSVTNESVTLTDYKGTTANDDLTGTIIVQNATTYEPLSGECNVTTSSGDIACNGTIGTTSITITYSYLPSAYLSAGTSRTLVTTMPVLLVVVIFLFIAGFLTLKRSD